MIRLVYIAVILSLVGCHCVRREDAVKRLNDNRAAYEQIATSWIRGVTSLRDLYRFGEGEYRCNGIYVSDSAGTVTIEVDGHKTTGRSFEDVSLACGVSSRDLRRALDQLKVLRIYGVSVEEMGTIRWVNILLEGSAWTPWGFRYVRPDRQKDLTYFRQLVAEGGFHRDVCFEEIQDGWFHFESDR